MLPIIIIHKECLSAVTIDLYYSYAVRWEVGKKKSGRPMIHMESTVVSSFASYNSFQISFLHKLNQAKAHSCHAFSTDSAGPRWGWKTFLFSYTLARRNYRNIWYCGSGKFAILTLPKAIRNWGSKDLLSQMASKGHRGLFCGVSAVTNSFGATVHCFVWIK